MNLIVPSDMSLVPIQTLPIQATLHFQRLTSEVALPYLQTICTAEGCPIEANTLADMLSVSRDGHVDLRKCINELQFWAPFGGSVARQDELKTGTNLKSQEYARSVEALSFADCFRAEVIEAGHCIGKLRSFAHLILRHTMRTKTQTVLMMMN